MMKSNEQIPDKKPKSKKTEKKVSQDLKRNEENVLSTLKALSDKEKELLAQRDQLLGLEETLKKRIINEIETKKSTVSNLQTEIPELKQRIEDLAKVLKIPVVKQSVN